MPCSLTPAQCRDNYNVPRRSRTIGEAAAATRPRVVRVVKLESGRSRGPRGEVPSHAFTTWPPCWLVPRRHRSSTSVSSYEGCVTRTQTICRSRLFLPLLPRWITSTIGARSVVRKKEKKRNPPTGWSFSLLWSRLRSIGRFLFVF